MSTFEVTHNLEPPIRFQAPIEQRIEAVQLTLENFTSFPRYGNLKLIRPMYFCWLDSNYVAIEGQKTLPYYQHRLTAPEPCGGFTLDGFTGGIVTAKLTVRLAVDIPQSTTQQIDLVATNTGLLVQAFLVMANGEIVLIDGEPVRI